MDKKTIGLLLLIIILGTFLRIYAIGSESFWIDEGATALTMERYEGGGILKNIYTKGQILPEYYKGVSDLPVYYYTLSYWTKLFRTSETSLRMFSAVFGIAAIIFVFVVAKELMGRKNALLSSFLFAVSLPAIELSQEARPYSIYLFFGAASTYYFIRLLKDNRWITSGLYVFFTILGLYTHYLFELLLVFQGAYALFHISYMEKSLKGVKGSFVAKGSPISRVAAVFLIIAILASPLVPRTFREANLEPWWGPPTMESFTKFFVRFSTWLYPSEEARSKIKSGALQEIGVGEMSTLLSVILTAMLSYALAGYGLFVKARNSKGNFLKEEKGSVFLAGWFFVPIAIGSGASIIMSTNIFSSSNYFAYVIPPLVILIAEGMLSLKPIYRTVIFAVFLVALVLPLHAYYANVNKQEWREAAMYVKEQAKSDEPILFSIYSGEVVFRYYHGDNDNFHGIRNIEEVRERTQGKERIWLLLSFWKYYDPNGAIQNYITDNYQLISRKDFFDIVVYHYQKKEKADGK